jgi:hypothetical protein
VKRWPVAAFLPLVVVASALKQDNFAHIAAKYKICARLTV